MAPHKGECSAEDEDEKTTAFRFFYYALFFSTARLFPSSENTYSRRLMPSSAGRKWKKRAERDLFIGPAGSIRGGRDPKRFSEGFPGFSQVFSDAEACDRARRGRLRSLRVISLYQAGGYCVVFDRVAKVNIGAGSLLPIVGILYNIIKFNVSILKCD